MYLIVDNHDSFTYNLANLVAETGRQVEVRPCDTITVDEITSMKPTGIIISPGPKGPADAKESLDIVREFKNTMPILGVCLGMQILAHTPGLPWYAAKSRCTAKLRPFIMKEPAYSKVCPQHLT